jgi:DNA mismatch repair protein MutS
LQNEAYNDKIGSKEVKFMEPLSPMMTHYMEVKNHYKDCLVLYRLGDFYELFFDDAITASRELEITLTGRDCGREERAPMCGVPYHSVQSYIGRLISKGYKVAICEQMEDPALAKGMVKREVIRVITPGTIVETNMLDEKKNNFLASIFKVGIYYGLSYTDVSTGEFYTTQITEGNNFNKLLSELSRFTPAEIVVNEEMFKDTISVTTIKNSFNTYITTKSDDEQDIGNIINEVNFDKLDYSKQSTKMLLEYIKETQKIDLKHINKIEFYDINNFMILDAIARKNLELTETIRDRNKKGSLLWVLDKTATSMGGRLLRKWLDKPLTNVEEINNRLEGVAELKQAVIQRGEISDVLKKIYDIERLAGKVAYGSVNARDMISLKNSLRQLPNLKELISDSDSQIIKDLYLNFDVLEDVEKLIDESINDDPPMSTKEGGIIKNGFNDEVDKLRTASTEGKNWILAVEAKEREKTSIKGLKVGFNKVFGYYIEITKSYLNMVPDRFIRKQTLANCERYITEELKDLENTILGAEEKVVNLEYELFTGVREEISKSIERLQITSNVVATLDVITSLAEIADNYNYIMPTIDNSNEINIKDGRHPVVERLIPSGSFVPNDTLLNTDEDRINIITGPNMAGKSTFMRQVALIVIMAQIGSFVPASFAKIGVADKIFTRVGASDDLASGQSTFMVEMSEVANILSNATKNSLLILDEIGRGTSTFDGLSIAWAVVEYLSDPEKIGARTLFATHYHELTELEDKLEGVKNYCIAVKEKGEDVIFLRKIIRGGADESYGIHVAKLAGVPNTVISRANRILKDLKETDFSSKESKEKKKENSSGQFDLFNYKLGEIASELDKINLNELTPIDALNVLSKLKSKL